MTNNLTADASPEKRLFISLLTRDISLVAAFLDLIDNSINSALAPFADKLTTAESYFSALDDPEISASTSIDIEFSAESVKIADNATGIDSETARSHAFKFGRAAPDSHASLDRLSVYGIGLKRAIFKMGDQISIVSDHEQGGFALDLDVPAWAALQQGVWSFPITERPNADADTTGTVIEITHLHEDVATRLDDGMFEGHLIKTIGRTYHYFLDKFVTISVNGESVAPDSVQVSENRTIEAVTIANATCAIVAGLGPTDSNGHFRDATSGWFVLCNGRTVVSADKSSLTGWGSYGLPIHQPKHRPFLGIVMFVSEDPESLPWNTTKASVNEDSIAWQRARREMVSTAKAIVNFLDRRYTESGTEVESSELNEARGGSVNPLASSLAKPRKFKPPAPKKDPTIRIQYDAKRADVTRISKHLRRPGMSGSEVGRHTLDFFLRNEVGDEE
ncbi:ATP-binding protein [Candidatus Spongiisocius sp.]|uniref:ATP-binding protein n=1 Tax=Candidatus Spongiisocius sp. TaxID=3101273 RepID=UPI003B58D777